MKKIHLCLTLIFAAALSAAGQEVKKRVHTEYARQTDQTQVAADSLYVINTPDQFVQLQLRATHRGQRPAGAAERIELEFISFAGAAKYQAESARRLSLVADGETHALGTLTYSAIPGGKLFKVQLPPSARVKGDVILEAMSGPVTPEQFKKIAAARGVEFHLGGTRFALDATQLGILREFAAYTVAPGAGAVVAAAAGNSPHAASLPPELSGATLPDTLKWLRKQLEKHGAMARQGRIEQLVLDDFKTCKLKYKFVTRPAALPTYGRDVPPPATEYQVDLADLSPETVRAYDADGYSQISFATQNRESKIRMYFRGGTGNAIPLSSASLKLAQTKDGPAIAAALARAINLCQPKP